MTDAELGKLVYGAIDEAGFSAALLARVRLAVTSAIAAAGPAADVGADHAAGDRLDAALAGHGEDAALAREVRRSEPVRRSTGSAAVAGRANAFRTMAGVRV